MMVDFKCRKINGKWLYIDPRSTYWFVENHKVTDFRDYYSKEAIIQLTRINEKLRSEITISFVEMHLSTSCNMNCVYCYVPEIFRKSGGLMNYDIAEKTINSLLESQYSGNIINLCFHGGEPLIAKDILMKIVESFKKERRLHFSIQTNGNL